MINSNTYMRYLRLGLSLRPVRGKQKSEQEYAYAMHVDGVQYVLNDAGVYEETCDSTDMIEMLKNMDAIVNSTRHDKVLAVQNFLEASLQKRVWCEVACDTQLGILFGTEDGEICQLAMDFRSPEKFEEYKDEIYSQLTSMGVSEDKLPEIDPMDVFVLTPFDRAHEALFSTFKCSGIVLDYLDQDGE